MINAKEMIILATSALVLGYIIAFTTFSEFRLATWGLAFLLTLLILLVNTFGKKLTAWYYNVNIEVSHWHIKRYGYWRWMYFKKLFPVWFILPLIFIWMTDGFIKWLAIMTFEATPLPSKAKRQFVEVEEWDLAMIVVGGALFNVVLAFISYLLSFTDFAMLNLMFILFNLIPISDLDGTKVFFGSKFLWVFVVAMALAILFLLEITGALNTVILATIIGASAVVLFYYLKLH